MISGGSYVKCTLPTVSSRGDRMPPPLPPFTPVLFMNSAFCRYACYNDVPEYGPTPPVGSCAGCKSGSPNQCYVMHEPSECSSCNESVVPYCQECCPRNYTEQYYMVRHSGWPTPHAPPRR